MASQITVTGKWGAAVTITTKVFKNIKKVEFNNDNGMLYVTTQNDTVEEFDISANTTLTCTLSSGNFTWAVS